MTRLNSKRIFVSAAGQGIGRAIATACAAAGADVFATDRDSALLGGLDCATGALDVTDAPAVAEIIGGFAPEVLINCAGIVHTDTVETARDDDLDAAFELNVKGMIYSIRAALPAMLERGEGNIINIASIASSTKGFPNRLTYSIAKGGVIGLTKSVAADYMTRGIRCNCISPGTIDSPSLQDRMHQSGDYETARAAFIARQPMGRLGTPEEVGALAVYLASDDTRYMTGQDVRIDGGTTA